MRFPPFSAQSTNRAVCQSPASAWLDPSHPNPSLTATAMLAVMLLVTYAVAATDPPLAKMIDTDDFQGQLAGIDKDWNLTFRVERDERQVTAADLQSWGEFRDREGSSLVLLADGGMLATEVLEISRAHVTVKPKSWRQLKMPLEVVRGIIFRPPAGTLQRDRLIFDILSATGSKDKLLLKNGDRISGVLVDPPDAADSASFRLETKSDGYTIPRDRLVAVTFNPTLIATAKPRPLHAWAGFRDGSLLLVDQVAMVENHLELKLPAGIVLRSFPDRPARLWREFRFLQPASPRITYLSKLKPLANGYKPVAFLDTAWPYQADRNVLGGRLRASGDVCLQGIGMHSASRLAYSLDEEYRRFEADLAIDDAAGRAGSVQFQVVVDKGAGWQSGFKSEIIRGAEAPVPVNVDLRGVRRIVLLVNFADHGDSWDHANWLNARLIK